VQKIATIDLGHVFFSKTYIPTAQVGSGAKNARRFWR
jgi:hypothetical protein